MKPHYSLYLIVASLGVALFAVSVDSGQDVSLLDSKTSHRCGEKCGHGDELVLSRDHVSFAERPQWIACEKGDWIPLGFEIDGQSGGWVSMHETLSDGRVVTSVLLESGDDLFIARNGDDWEGRMIPRGGGNGWRIRGDATGATVESLERGALICSWEDRDGSDVAGLPPARGPFPESAPTLNDVEEIAPLLNSLPGANGVIYLDFDGETVSNTQWNSSYTGGKRGQEAFPGGEKTQESGSQ